MSRGAVVPWCRGAVVPWCRGAVVPWCRGAVVPWCRGAVVPWCRGAVVLWLDYLSINRENPKSNHEGRLLLYVRTYTATLVYVFGHGTHV